MISRVLPNIVLTAAVFLAPLVIHPERLAHPGPWLGFAVALIVMLSQPAMTFREASDRGSALGIFVAMIVTQLAAVIDFGLHQSEYPAALITGAAIAAAGLTLRLWAIRTLGRFFTSAVRVVGGQSVVSAGPYRVLRHPSYTGALLTALGTAVALESVVGAALVLALCVPAYLYRIATEEKALIAELGDTYAAYRRGTWGLVPGLR
jgi:protein-S-isoprenylcysteine O-methyltransferase